MFIVESIIINSIRVDFIFPFQILVYSLCTCVFYMMSQIDNCSLNFTFKKLHRNV